MEILELAWLEASHPQMLKDKCILKCLAQFLAQFSYSLSLTFTYSLFALFWYYALLTDTEVNGFGILERIWYMWSEISFMIDRIV